jgi:immune inhibitor A
MRGSARRIIGRPSVPVLPVLAVLFLGCPPAFADPGPLDPPGHSLTLAERELWSTQNVALGAPHLEVQAARRQAGETTTLNVVVILVDFPDLAADREAHPPEYFRELLFSRGTHPTGSAADFFAASSRGRLELTGEVRGWYTVSRNKGEYTAELGGIGYYPKNSQALAEEAIHLADAHINYAHFDNEGPDLVPDSGDDDELIDGILVVHAGDGREGGNSGPGEFTSIQWFTKEVVPVDGVFGLFFTLNPERGTVGVYIHEMGHLLGLPDLYPTRASLGGSSFGTGVWSMMSGGVNLADGVYPGDFDAWSKTKLGFADVVRVFDRKLGEVIRPTVETGLVYRLWGNGAGGDEYFLLENRRPEGLDRALPGGGLVLYHVDERVTTDNNDPRRYLVAVEQADGLFQLENRFRDPSVGDAGDPFQAGQRFGRTTVPSSRSNEGSDTYVSMYDITGPGPDGAMTATLSVEPNAVVELVGVNMTELEGNGNGLVEAGEVAGVFPQVSVTRLPAFELTLRTTSLDPLGEVLDPLVALGTVPVGGTVAPPEPIRVRVSESLPSDPYGLPLRLDVDWRDDMGRSVGIELGLGTVVGLAEDFELLEHGWVHDRIRPTAFDQWFYGPSLGENGSAGFKVGYALLGYMRGIDAYLESPPVLLPTDSELAFDHLVDVVATDTTETEAGGLVELSLNGADWFTAEVVGGYPRRYVGRNPEWNGRNIFSGTLEEARFHTARVDLSGLTGSLRVRFRFFSDGQSQKGLGWHVDNVRVRSKITPVRVLTHSSAVDGDAVVLSWSLGDPLPAAVRVLRGADPATAAALGEGWRPALPADSFVDRGGARRLPSVYWLQGQERDGSPAVFGPWTVDAASLLPQVSLAANPTRGASTLVWNAPLADGARVRIFDLQGRVLVDSPLPGVAGRWSWSGRDAAGRRVAPGVYFAAVRGAGFPVPTLRLVRLP